MYYKVTILEKGNRSEKVVEAPNKRAAVAKVKKENPKAVVVNTVETNAPLEDMFKKLGKDLSTI